MKRSEIFREFAVFLYADPGFSFEEGQEMFRMAGRQMTKQARHEMIALLKDFEVGTIDHEDIQDLWNGSGARFYIIGEDAVRHFLYRARHALQQSFFLKDIEDMRAGIPFKVRRARKHLTAAENHTLQSLADIIYEIDLLDPQFKKDRKRLLRERLTAEDEGGVMKLVATIARGDLTEELLQAAWQKTAASDLEYTRENIAANVYNVAQLIEERILQNR